MVTVSMRQVLSLMKKNIFSDEKKQPTSLGGIDSAAKIMSLLKMDIANTIIEDIAKKR